tara:strand:+ start:2399 stop:2665 length:267 start_codon:yes stop_codon:yes gene_type:complete
LDTARNIYLALKDNASAVAQLRTWRTELALACVDPAQALETTSFTLNGQSGSGELRGTKADLLKIIGQVLWQVDNNAALSTRSTGVQF